MTTWYSSDLGWTSGQDVSQEFSSLVGMLRPGDTLVLEHMFRISGSNHKLPDNFTLTAEAGGGFDVRDAGSNSNPLLLLGNGNTLDNVTISTTSSTPDTGYSGNNPSSGVDYAPGSVIGAFGVNDITISSSAFEGNVAMHFDLRFVDNVTVEDSSFSGGLYQMRWLGEGSNYTIDNSVFQDALGDGIKTVQTGGGGISKITITDSYFLDNARDGIDTTGGFQDSLISNTVFVGGGIDIKSIIENPEDLVSAQMNSNITIEGSQFIDTKNGIVTTMLDRAGLMNLSNVDDVMPNNITVTDTIFEMTNNNLGDQRAFLIKDGHNITWDNVQLLGGVSEVRLMNAEAPNGWSAYNIGGDVSYGPARDGVDFSPNVGPVDKDLTVTQEQEPEEPVQEAPEPVASEPAVEPPAPAEAQPSAPTYTMSTEDGFFLSGTKSFNGTSQDVIEEAPTDALNMAAGTVSFSFSADKVNGMQGLVSRDAKGAEQDSGHFTSYIDNGTLYVRFQDGETNVKFSHGGIKAGQEYDVIAAFGDGKVSTWVNGQSIGERALDYDWLDSDEYLQVGANGWASAGGSAGYIGAFSGTISDVEIEAAESTGISVEPEPVVEVQEPEEVEEPVFVAPVEPPEPKPVEEVVAPEVVEPVLPVEQEPVSAPSQTGGEAGSEVVFALNGTRTFHGNARTVVEEAPTDDLNIESGSIAFSFAADKTKGMQGLVSRDAKGTDEDGGHFTSYIKNGTLHVRFQEADADVAFTKAGIKAGQSYDFEASFGDGMVSATLDGQSLGQEKLDYDWVDTDEYLQVGANGWASTSGGAGYMGAFDGSISDLVIESYSDATATQPAQQTQPETESPAEDAYTLVGTRKFDGSSRPVVEEAPTDALKIEAGKISFGFNAETVKGMQGLVSRDAKGTDEDGGHFTSYIQNGTLYVRFQEEDADHVFSASGIRAGEDYEFHAEFGGGTVAAWLNGDSIGAGALNYDWLDTEEYLQVGANGWASASGEAGFKGAFDGTISDLVITEKDVSQAVNLDDIVPTADGNDPFADGLDPDANGEQTDWFLI